MATSDRNPPESLRVMCPTCHERLEVRLTEKPQVVACTFCEGRIAVPSREHAHQQLQAQRPLPTPKVEEYKVAAPAEDLNPARRRKSDAVKATNGKAKKAPAPSPVVVACPTCHERMRTQSGESTGKIACTFCGSAVPVPSRDAIARWKAKQIQPEAKEAVGEYAVGALSERPALRMHLFDRLAEIRSEAPIPPPRWTFFSRVFSFPWHREVMFRWGAITIGFTALSLLGSFIVGGGMGSGPRGIGIMGLGFFALPMLWIAIFTFSYSADSLLCVIESTAYGHDRIDAWPEGGWKEWMPKLIYVGWVAALPAVASAGVGRLAEIMGIPFWPVLLGTLFVLYPIVLMSALEANSVWVPLTWPIVRSLIYMWWGWLLFYALTGAPAGGLAALLLLGVPSFGPWALVPFGPLLAAFLLIYARLLGRLAWKIGEVLSA